MNNLFLSLGSITIFFVGAPNEGGTSACYTPLKIGRVLQVDPVRYKM